MYIVLCGFMCRVLASSVKMTIIALITLLTTLYKVESPVLILELDENHLKTPCRCQGLFTFTSVDVISVGD